MKDLLIIPNSINPDCKIEIAGYSMDGYQTVDPQGHTILCNFGEVSDGLSFFPQTDQIILNNNQQSLLINNFDQIFPKIAEDLGISEQAAYEKSVDFFSSKEVSVQPTGIQGKCYNLMQGAQNCIPMSYTSRAVSIMKTTGMNGLQVIRTAPLTFVGATYIGAIFFGYFGSVAGNNSLGVVLNSTSFILSRPMRGVEITLNGLLLRPISNRIGLPLVLNGTQQILAGKGLSMEEYATIGIAFDRINNSTIVRKIKRILEIARE